MLASLIHLLIYLAIVGLIVWVALYLLRTLPIPDPFATIIRVVVIVIAVIAVIYALLGLIGAAPSLRLT